MPTNGVYEWSSSDPLGEALHVLRMHGAFYSRCEFTAPWGLALPAIPDSIMFHIVIAGECWLELGGHEPRRLRPGEIGLAPHGAGHHLASAPGAPGPDLFDLPRESISDRYELVRYGGDGDLTSLVCGTVFFDHPAARQLVGLLPGVIVAEAGRSSDSEWIASTLRFMASEARHPRPGGETIITRLADILVIQAIRSWIEGDPAAQSGWLGALQDRQIGQAISRMHRDPARGWTVASLANEAAMSRSAFSARFTHLVGEPPMQYLTRWRMQVAATSLAEDNATVGELAFRFGYASEAAFSRAFKRFVGVSPGAVRRGRHEVKMGQHNREAVAGVWEESRRLPTHEPDLAYSC